eukprot:1188501-Prorocentrum_minimum.AAC.1
MAGRAIGARPIPQAFEDTGGSNRRQRWVDQSDPFVAAQAYDGRTLWTRSSSYVDDGDVDPGARRGAEVVVDLVGQVEGVALHRARGVVKVVVRGARGGGGGLLRRTTEATEACVRAHAVQAHALAHLFQGLRGSGFEGFRV